MDKTAAIESVKKYAEIVQQHFSVKKIILYGSYAHGTPRTDSDIDVAVVINKLEGDFLLSATRLFQLKRDIDARIEPVLLEENDPSGFLEEILKSGEVVFSGE